MEQEKTIDIEALKKAIHVGFDTVLLGNGVGVREAEALDDYNDPIACAAAREEDRKEQHWTDIAEDKKWYLGTALSFTDVEGFKYLLPAAMIASLDGKADSSDSIVFHLCITRRPYVRPPHPGSREYTDYLKDNSAQKTAEYYGFNELQLHAIALYFYAMMIEDKTYLFSDDKDDRERLEQRNTHAREHSKPGEYVLTLDDEARNFNEECRILREWLELGKIKS